MNSNTETLSNVKSVDHARNVDVSVVMLTYFHEDYLEQAINSVLDQKGDIIYEIIISDDHSTDNTRSIIESYYRQYPNVIVPIYNNHTIGIPANMYQALEHCTGECITFLSGDDYWVDNDKLLEQYSFLKKNCQYFSVLTGVEARNNSGEVLYQMPKANARDRVFTLTDYLKGMEFPTHGLMMRNIMTKEDGKQYFSFIRTASSTVDDLTICILVLMKSHSYILDRISCVYRVTNENKHNYNALFNRRQRIHNELQLQNNIYQKFHIDSTYLYANLLGRSFLQSLQERNLEFYRSMKQELPNEYQDYFRSNIGKKLVAKAVLDKIGNRLVKEIKKRKAK